MEMSRKARDKLPPGRNQMDDQTVQMAAASPAKSSNAEMARVEDIKPVLVDAASSNGDENPGSIVPSIPRFLALAQRHVKLY